VKYRRLQILGALFFQAITLAYASAQATPNVTYPSRFGISSALSDLPTSPSRAALPLIVVPLRQLPPLSAPANNAADQALQTVAGPLLDVEAQSGFPGIGQNGWIPGDPNIAVEPNHILKIDNNGAEQALRPIVLGRKNWLFAGSEAAAHRTAILCSLVQTCKHLQVNPFVYPRDVIDRVSTHPARLVLELTPREWKRLRKVSAAEAAA
jgi:hypothetical protein